MRRPSSLLPFACASIAAAFAGWSAACSSSNDSPPGLVDAGALDAAATSDAGVRDAAPLRDASSDADADAGAIAASGVCRDGWCWASPFPGALTITSAWGASSKDVWAVSDIGLAMHWDGARWTGVETGVTRALASVWGTSSTDVWAVGAAGTIVHWDGSSWSTTPSVTSPALTGVWAASPKDVWAVGASATILHWDGSSWTVMTSPLSVDLTAVAGSGPNDVWFGGASTSLVHWTDGVFTTLAIDPALQGTGVAAIRAFSPNDLEVTATGDHGTYHWSGAAWSTEATFGVLAGTSDGDLWGTPGSGGGVAHWDGSSWTYPTLGDASDVVGLAAGAMWELSPDDVWLFNSFSTRHFDGHAWSLSPGGFDVPNFHPYGTTGWAASPTDVWTTGSGDDGLSRVYHFDGGAFSEVPSLRMFGNANWFGIGGTGSNDVWLAGVDINQTPSSGVIGHWDGVSGSQTPIPRPIENVCASSATSAWASGYGAIEHWDGKTWSAIALPAPDSGADLYVVTCDADDVWVISPASAFRWDGAAFQPIAAPPTNLTAAWAFGGTIFAIGEAGLAKYSGGVWSSEDLPDSTPPFNPSLVWGSSLDDVWVGDPNRPELAHWNGSTWAFERTPTHAGANWLTGAGGTMFAGVSAGLPSIVVHAPE